MHAGSAVTLAYREICRKLAELSEEATPGATIGETALDEVVGEGAFVLDGGRFWITAEANLDMPCESGTLCSSVAVDPALGRLRLRRAVGVYSAGQMNPRTARSQMVGGLIWAWGKTTMHRSELDPATARWLSKNLSGGHIPANADIGTDITIEFVDEYDHHASAFGGKGVGELGASGVDAAIADAVFDAVGIRFRELPITQERVLEMLAAAGSRGTDLTA